MSKSLNTLSAGLALCTLPFAVQQVREEWPKLIKDDVTPIFARASSSPAMEGLGHYTKKLLTGLANDPHWKGGKGSTTHPQTRFAVRSNKAPKPTSVETSYVASPKVRFNTSIAEAADNKNQKTREVVIAQSEEQGDLCGTDAPRDSAYDTFFCDWK